jgi:nucleotide-binding universal stress UspA family protein
MEHIIVPIDFSGEATQGLEMAILFSAVKAVNIQMVYVQRISSDFLPGAAEEELKKSKEKFEDMVRLYSPRLKNNSKLSYIVKRGKVYEEVVNQANAFENSLIAASTHGASGFEEFFIGSNAFKIISVSERPVLVIRRGKAPSAIRKIVMPIDISPDSRQKVQLTLDLAKLFGAEIHIVTITSSKSKRIHERLASYKTQIVRLISGKGIVYHTKSIVAQDMVDKLVEYTDNIGADLISIVSERGNSVSNLILGNTTQELLNKTNVPVLTIPPREIHVKGSFSTYAD